MRGTLAIVTALSLALSACPTTNPRPDDDDDIDISLLPAVPVGALVITEILAHPNVGRPEFIEVINASDASVSLAGCKLVDGGTGEHEYDITVPVDLEPGEYAILASAAGLGAIPEDLPADVEWSDVTLAQADETESVALQCPDGTGARTLTDEVAFHWNGLDLHRGHSWQLASAADATANDDPLNWCEAPSDEDAAYASVDGVPDYGTPGAVTLCDTPGGATPQASGDILISEILIDEFTGLREWFELTNPGSVPLDLRGCTLGDVPEDGSTDANLHVLDPDLGETTIEPGGVLLLSKTDTDITPDGSVVSDYPYGALGFNNSALQVLWLECPREGGGDAVEVDSLLYDWGTYGSDFEGRSLALSADGSGFCLAADEDVYFTATQDDPPETFIARGTPGAPNPACPVPEDAPGEGDLVFTEVMVRSSAGVGHNEEWFEMLHVGISSVSLLGCTLVNGNADGDVDEHVIEAPLGLSASPGDRLVFAKSSASDSLEACALPADYTYSTNISFNNDDPESLSLVCPGNVVVDIVQFDGGFPSGIPWQLRLESEDSELNDNYDNWCVSETVSGYSWACTVGDDTNYGTPGEPSACGDSR
ncbi:MAG: lamin tail domain-containing protein [Proteobacteria bacterium]|nr:lamin tail domain-containing protein [Pseudomonadota bacterium]